MFGRRADFEALLDITCVFRSVGRESPQELTKTSRTAFSCLSLAIGLSVSLFTLAYAGNAHEHFLRTTCREGQKGSQGVSGR